MAKTGTLADLATGKDEAIIADLSWGGQTTLNGGFFHELPLMSAAGAIASYPGPLRVIMGPKETIVTPQPISGNQLLQYREGTKDLMVLEPDHDFGAGTSTGLAEKELAPETVEWFRNSL
ncbi:MULTISPECIES: hypothetical protein [Paracoccus]|jgi:hypothetical protein|uniref:hypothetical protein n=1 Tax=Paracoccus TaxID=265 RepID=UPI00258B0F98|nr:hypothetical protein [Paracoccus sp. (in: a-proteobacteria)]